MVIKTVAAVLATSGLPRVYYWKYALSFAKTCINQIAINTDGTKMSPMQAYYGLIPSYKDLLPFGCKVYVPNRNNNSPLHTRGIAGIYLGRDPKTSNGNIVEIIATGDIVTVSNPKASPCEFPGQELGYLLPNRMEGYDDIDPEQPPHILTPYRGVRYKSPTYSFACSSTN